MRFTTIGMFMFLWFFTSVTYGQERTISGTVFEKQNATLPGVAIRIKGTSTGAITDSNGKFSLKVSKNTDVLEFSYIGFISKEIQVGTQNTIEVFLEEDLKKLDEVIVVGYAEQKKINLTGAVSSIEIDDAVNQPVTNTSQLLYGGISGVNVSQTSGLPGSDASNITIRGIGSFGNTSPLIVIDGIQYDDMATFNNLAPSDIANISVLKDASASAIYGARGANGVIIVTTKGGKKDTFKVNYNNAFSMQEATVVPEYLDAFNYATLMNEKFENEAPGGDPRYLPEQMEKIKNQSHPDQFSNTNWAKEMLKPAPMQNHYLSLSGGNDKTKFRVSLGYLTQDAIIDSKYKVDRYNFGVNLNSKVKEWMDISLVSNMYWKSTKGPTEQFGGITETFYQAQRYMPTIPIKFSNGNWAFSDAAYTNVNFSRASAPKNPLYMGVLGDYKRDHINFNNRFAVNFKIIKGLEFEPSFAANINSNRVSDFLPTYENRDYEGTLVAPPSINKLIETSFLNYRLMNENVLKYRKSWDSGHNLSVLGGYSATYYRNDFTNGGLSNFPSDIIHEFNGGGVSNPYVEGGAAEVAWVSWFGRVNYNYKDKYMFEANMRKDASSKFGPGNRSGYFPSMSAGWVLSEESFMADLDKVSMLKLRGSWGLSGNDRIGNYIWAQTYNAGLDYVLGNNAVVGGVGITSLANPNITWETTNQYDIGLDLYMFNNQLSFVADYFSRRSSDILYNNFPVPGTIGISTLASRNSAEMINNGLELGLAYRKASEAFSWGVNANVTYFLKNEVVSLGEGSQETISYGTIIREGVPFKAYYGYVMDGIFQSEEEIANAPVQFGGNTTAPGDIRYKDINNDGVIDQDDREVIGNPNPEWIFNFGGNFAYKGFDVNILFQGVANVDRIIKSNGAEPLTNERANALKYWENRWTPENPSTTLPRLGGGFNNEEISSFYIEDVSYLRLKNIELGYTIPKALTEKIKVEKFRIFAGGQNLLTFTQLDNFDPEGAAGLSSDRNLPLYKVYTAGLNLTF